MAKKILFFDDEREIAMSMQKNLEINDYDVDLVCTINEFIESIENNSITYDLILMDVMSPLPNGDEKSKFSKTELDNMNYGLHVGEVLADKIRNNHYSKYAKVPIIFYTIRNNVRAFDNSKHVRKPVLVKELIEEIDKLIINQK